MFSRVFAGNENERKKKKESKEMSICCAIMRGIQFKIDMDQRMA
jgi:hypothetical protein